MPGARPASPERREAVDGDDAGRVPRLQGAPDRGADGGIVRIVEPRDAAPDVGLVRARVAGHDRPVGEPHDESRIVSSPVRVDDEAGEPRQDRRRVQMPGEGPRHRGGADVIGDVAAELGLGKAQIAEIGRHGVRGVVAQDERPGTRRPRYDFHWMEFEGRCPGLRGRQRQACGDRETSGRQLMRRGLTCHRWAGNATAPEAILVDSHGFHTFRSRRSRHGRRFCGSLPRGRRDGHLARLRSFRECRRRAFRQRLLARLPGPAGSLRVDADRGSAGPGRCAPALLVPGDGPRRPRLRGRSLLLAPGDPQHDGRQRDVLRHDGSDLRGAHRLARPAPAGDRPAPGSASPSACSAARLSSARACRWTRPASGATCYGIATAVFFASISSSSGGRGRTAARRG